MKKAFLAMAIAAIAYLVYDKFFNKPRIRPGIIGGPKIEGKLNTPVPDLKPKEGATTKSASGPDQTTFSTGKTQVKPVPQNTTPEKQTTVIPKADTVVTGPEDPMPISKSTGKPKPEYVGPANDATVKSVGPSVSAAPFLVMNQTKFNKSESDAINKIVKKTKP